MERSGGIVIAFVAFSMVVQNCSPALSNQTVLKGSVHKTRIHTTGYFAAHPKVKAATVGAGVGAGAGALTGLITHRGVMRGAVVGAGTGAGVGLVRSSRTMNRHPIVKDVATGTLVAGGLGLAASRRHSTALKTAGVGAAIGLGAGLLQNKLK